MTASHIPTSAALLSSQRDGDKETNNASSITTQFSPEHEVNSWHAHTRNNLSGVSSYVKFARFNSIVEWEEPALFTCVLENFNSLTTLRISETEISDELPDHISCGEFGKRITALFLYSPRCTISTVISASLSFPNLNSLTIETYGIRGAASNLFRRTADGVIGLFCDRADRWTELRKDLSSFALYLGAFSWTSKFRVCSTFLYSLQRP